MNVQDLDLTKIILAVVGIVTPMSVGAVAIFKKLVNELNKQNNEQQIRTEKFYKDSLESAEKREKRLLDTTEKFADAHQQVATSIYALTDSTKAIAQVVDKRNATLDSIEETLVTLTRDVNNLKNKPN